MENSAFLNINANKLATALAWTTGIVTTIWEIPSAIEYLSDTSTQINPAKALFTFMSTLFMLAFILLIAYAIFWFILIITVEIYNRLLKKEKSHTKELQEKSFVIGLDRIIKIYEQIKKETSIKETYKKNFINLNPYKFSIAIATALTITLAIPCIILALTRSIEYFPFLKNLSIAGIFALVLAGFIGLIILLFLIIFLYTWLTYSIIFKIYNKITEKLESKFIEHPKMEDKTFGKFITLNPKRLAFATSIVYFIFSAAYYIISAFLKPELLLNAPFISKLIKIFPSFSIESTGFMQLLLLLIVVLFLSFLSMFLKNWIFFALTIKFYNRFIKNEDTATKNDPTNSTNLNVEKEDSLEIDSHEDQIYKKNHKK